MVLRFLERLEPFMAPPLQLKGICFATNIHTKSDVDFFPMCKELRKDKTLYRGIFPGEFYLAGKGKVL